MERSKYGFLFGCLLLTACSGEPTPSVTSKAVAETPAPTPSPTPQPTETPARKNGLGLSVSSVFYGEFDNLSDATPKHEFAKIVYKSAVDKGIILSYNAATQTVYVSDDHWKKLIESDQDLILGVFLGLIPPGTAYLVCGYPSKNRYLTNIPEINAQQRQIALATQYKNYYDYWTSQSEVFQRHHDSAALADAENKRQQMQQNYNQALTPAFLERLSQEEWQKEKKLQADIEKENRLAPVRARAREDAEEFNAYKQEFEKNADFGF